MEEAAAGLETCPTCTVMTYAGLRLSQRIQQTASTIGSKAKIGNAYKPTPSPLPSTRCLRTDILSLYTHRTTNPPCLS